jgi:carbon storage regulator
MLTQRQRREVPVLVLTRRANQSIMIGDDIVVTVLDVRGDQVRIGIKAPRSVGVHREEVFIALQRDGDRDGSSSDGTETDVIDLDRVEVSAVETVVAAPAD